MTSSSVYRGPLWFQKLRALERMAYSVERFICIASLVVMVFATGYAVMTRNLHIASPNYGELGLAALIPLTLVGGAMCTYLGSHISVEIMQVAPSRFLRNIAEIAAAVFSIVFACFYIYSGVILVEEFRYTGDKLLDLGTPLWILAAFFPFGMGLMIFHCIVRMLCVVFGAPKYEESGAAA
ncbi:TRAP transporter small permease [Alcaligenaceae bacterium]|nr:TRAP transporter small permease [Alcaligenaceae bacterium]